MNKKPSNKDLKDWKNFLESKEKVHNKDNVINQTKIKEEATIDLHGFSLDQANSKVEKFITECFEKKVLNFSKLDTCNSTLLNYLFNVKIAYIQIY